jgi:hypothetical protein
MPGSYRSNTLDSSKIILRAFIAVSSIFMGKILNVSRILVEFAGHIRPFSDTKLSGLG